MQTRNLSTRRRRSRRLGIAVAVLIALIALAGARAMVVRAQFKPDESAIRMNVVDKLEPSSVRVSFGSVTLLQLGD